MPNDCDPLIRDDQHFPRRPFNRPALNRIAYRTGEYGDMVEAMTRSIDSEVALSAWTHRGSDDPGIALLDGVGIIGDILTFYQERYANEAFHRTATWRTSVAELVRLLGYRLTPGLGGHARLAVEVKGDAPVTIPAHHPFKTDLEGQDKPAEFETNAELIAYPALSNFNLYRLRNYAASIAAGVDTLEIDTVDGSPLHADIAALDLKAGESILLMPEDPSWVGTKSASFTAQDAFQILKVKDVTTALGRTSVTFETTIAEGWDSPVKAYRLGRKWRHFGHASPPTYTASIKNGSNEITGTKEYDTDYLRHIHEDHTCGTTSSSFNIPGREIPLDAEVADLTRGSAVAVEIRAQKDGDTLPLIQRRTIKKIRATSVGFGNQTGPSTILTLSRSLLKHSSNSAISADVRDYRIHEITSPAIRLRPKATAPGGSIDTATDVLAFYGLLSDVRKLAGRVLSLLHDDGRAQELTCINERDDFTGGNGDPKMWALSFGTQPDGLTQSDFDEDTPTVTVYGNTVRGSQGKSVPMVVLGNGDKRQTFQTFTLPKPATHHLSPGADPAEVPQLTVYVDGRAATRVSSLFGQASDAMVYVLRTDDEGASHVQFGDGKTGARLTSGKDNVTAVFRTGTGARGVLPEGAQPSAKRIKEVTKLHIPAGVSGGADPESADNAKEAAPGKVQGLGRIVSLKDYETELLSIPGVSRVRAAWDMSDGTPAVVLRVLLQSGREAEYDAVRDAIQSFQRCRGSNRFALVIEQATLRQVHLDLKYTFDPALLEADVSTEVTAALGLMDAAVPEGLFALSHRQIGGPEYATLIEGCVQALPNVRWARVTSLGLLAASPVGVAPEDLFLPYTPRPLAERVTPLASELLQLHSAHFTLTAVPAETAEDCA